jgi:hypothetical protein
MITQNNLRVIKHRLKRAEVPDFNRLKKIKNFIAKEELDNFARKAINAYQNLLSNTTTPKKCAQELRGVNECDEGNGSVQTSENDNDR